MGSKTTGVARTTKVAKKVDKSKTKAKGGALKRALMVVALVVIVLFAVVDLALVVFEHMSLKVDGEVYLSVSLGEDEDATKDILRPYLEKYRGEYVGKIYTEQVSGWGGVRIADAEILEGYLDEGVEETNGKLAVVSDFDDEIWFGDKFLEAAGDYVIIGKAPEAFVVNTGDGEVEKFLRQVEEKRNMGGEDTFLRMQSRTREVVKFGESHEAIKFAKVVRELGWKGKRLVQDVTVVDLFNDVLEVYDEYRMIWCWVVMIEGIVLVLVLFGVLIAQKVN